MVVECKLQINAVLHARVVNYKKSHVAELWDRCTYALIQTCDKSINVLWSSTSVIYLVSLLLQNRKVLLGLVLLLLIWRITLYDQLGVAYPLAFDLRWRCFTSPSVTVIPRSRYHNTTKYWLFWPWVVYTEKIDIDNNHIILDDDWWHRAQRKKITLQFPLEPIIRNLYENLKYTDLDS